MSQLFPFPENFPSGYYSNSNPLFAPFDRGIDAARQGSTNMLHTDILTWRRKPGMSKWSSVNIAGDGINDFYGHVYSFNARVIVDQEDTVAEFTTSIRTQFFAKSVGEPMAYASVKDVLYFTNQFGDGQKKRIGGAATTKTWGIAGPTVAPTFVIDDNTTGARVRIGWKYKYSYKDSTDGHVSSSSPPSVSTGNNLDAIWKITVQGTANTRVDKISIFRTRDGGSTYEFLKDISNTGAGAITTLDQAPDTDLNQAILAPSEDDNDVPPSTASDVEFHADRLWLIDVDTVRFSLHSLDGKSVNGIAEECWPPLNTFRFNAPVKLLTSSAGLLVFTQEGIYIITGHSVDDFDPDIVYYGLGISNRRAVTKDGDTFYLFTNTKQIVRIGDRVDVLSDALSSTDLTSFNPATVRLTVFRNGTEAALYVSDADNTLLRYNVNTGTWSTPWEVDGTVITTSAIRAVQTSLGVWNLLIGPKLGISGFIWKEDSSTHLNDATAYACNYRLGSFVLAEHARRASLRSIITESTVAPTVTILPQAISGALASGLTTVPEPPLLVDTTTLISKRHYPQTTSQILVCRHFMCDLAWSAANDAAELYGLGIEYDPEQQERQGP